MNIIEKTEMLVMPKWSIPVIFLVPIAILVIMVIIAVVREIYNRNHNKKSTFMRDFCLMFIAAPVAIMIGFIVKSMEEPSGKYMYKAYLDDSVSISELCDEYTNIKQLDEYGLFYFEDKA